jgi:hypothetical protein
LAILGVSFRLLAKAVLPFALLFILSGCGGSSQKSGPTGTGVRGPGFRFEVPAGWTVRRQAGAVTAHHGGQLVSVTRFSLRKPYDPGRFDEVAKTLDSVADRLAKAAGSTLSESETTTVADRKVRAYRYGTRRIGFVLDGRREFQLFCTQTGDACDLLFSSFTLTGPPA